MDFEEYFSNNFNDGLSAPSKHILKFTFKAGQQSKQAEIDALKDKINKVLYAISQSELHGDRAIWGIQDEIKELLK